jgi:hypothetical protein
MLAGGAKHTVALTTNGAAVAWGSDYEGQCNLPSNLSTAIAVAAGAHHSLVLFETSVFAPRLFGPNRGGGGFRVRIQTLARKNYALEWKSNLYSGLWTALATNRGNGAVLQFSDPASPSSGRFYRVRQW